MRVFEPTVHAVRGLGEISNVVGKVSPQQPCDWLRSCVDDLQSDDGELLPSRQVRPGVSDLVSECHIE